ncbi:branched-chain amino acid transport system ATP-binding protein [Tistlia consotensis]|uniref:Branched-chain amino acid transport system ATP-binding protein n=1 Tax=Tistlia consotensis USBA 355 TaxID=560819 RepID=A0A1Y6B921_9PROT|nr:ABC transporter ATP-binding protein [Tistlia consotensis]SME90970.1 branched-chain amino acid transport system ATP-binding protein [Tistlia consotensis USBA 355]SNR27033.1 branched-chain amino acid transport system ATP-binding protein [Tistlia consotensis]
MLRIAGLHAAYGHALALHGVDLEVDEAEVVCLVGRNGVGKSSTMRAIVQDLIRVTGGTVEYDGRSLVGLAPERVIRRGIGYVPEDRRVFASMTVLENLRVPAPKPSGRGDDWTIERVFELFAPLSEYRHRKAGVLSGGEQQMLSIARSLLTNPRLLLLDEPHEGLAPKVADEVVGAIVELKRRGVSMLIAEQSLRTIRACADRVYVIDRGTTVFGGSAAAFEADPELARKYLTVQ